MRGRVVVTCERTSANESDVYIARGSEQVTTTLPRIAFIDPSVIDKHLIVQFVYCTTYSVRRRESVVIYLLVVCSPCLSVRDLCGSLWS